MNVSDPRGREAVKFGAPRKYNLLIVASNLWIGGAEVVIRNLAHHIDPRLFNLSVCHLKERGSIGDDLHQEGVDIVGIPQPKIYHSDYFSFLKLLKVIRFKQIDIVHSHTTHALIDAALCKVIIRNLRLVHTFHFGNYPHDKRRYMFMERVMGRVADRLVAVGDHQKKTIESAYGFPSTAMSTIWNGVNVSISSESLDLKKVIGSMERCIVGTIATLCEQKGLSDLLDVAAIMKNQGEKVVFVIAGEGVLRGQLEEKIARLGLTDTVFLLGWVKDAAARLLPLIDVFFQPSLWEAMSVVILEAMAAGKPIVATRVGDNPAVIEPNRDGLLVNARDVNEMTVALQRLIREPAMRTQLGLEAKKKFEETFTADRMARKYERLYLDAIEGQN